MTDADKPPTPSPTVVDPDGYPGHVASGELIESAWGNAVANTLRAQQNTDSSLATRATRGETLDGFYTWAGSLTVITDANGNFTCPTNKPTTPGVTLGFPPAVVACCSSPGFGVFVVTTGTNGDYQYWTGQAFGVGGPQANLTFKVSFIITAIVTG